MVEREREREREREAPWSMLVDVAQSQEHRGSNAGEAAVPSGGEKMRFIVSL